MNLINNDCSVISNNQVTEVNGYFHILRPLQANEIVNIARDIIDVVVLRY